MEHKVIMTEKPQLYINTVTVAKDNSCKTYSIQASRGNHRYTIYGSLYDEGDVIVTMERDEGRVLNRQFWQFDSIPESVSLSALVNTIFATVTLDGVEPTKETAPDYIDSVSANKMNAAIQEHLKI